MTRERLARNADEPFAHHRQGLVHTHQGSPKEAARAFEQAAALDPQWTEPVNHLAALLLTQNKQADAVRQLEAALERNPRNPAAYLTLARIQEEARHYPAAIALYERALEVIPDFGGAAARLALLLCERNAGPEDLDRALALVLDANRRQPGRADVLQAIAWVHYHRGAHDSALQLLGPIAERAPDDPLLNYHLGMALLKSGQPEKARGKLELALQEKTPFVGRADAEQALKTLKASPS
jgi:tetratricopeptide (TPR) repeat protein